MALRLIEATLFRLCLNGTITLHQAKVLRALYDGMACPLTVLQDGTGLCEEELWIALRGLECRGIVSESGGIYFLEKPEEKLLALVEASEKTGRPTGRERQVIVANARHSR